MTDFDKIVNSDNIEDKLKAVQDAICPNEVITEILNHETINWGSNSAISLITEIVSHPNTDVVTLMAIFLKYSSKVLSKLNKANTEIKYSKLWNSLKKNTTLALKAGCNLILHCNGNIKEMNILSKIVPKVDNFILKKTSQFYKFLI